MSTVLPLLAHIGSPNNPWIGVVTVSSWALMIVLVLVLTKKLVLESPGDLLLPLAAVVLVAGLSGSTPDWVNDQGPWAAPIGLVILVALLVAAFRDQVTLEAFNRATVVTLGVAAVAAAAAYAPLDGLWFPTDEPLPELGDAVVTAEITAQPDENGTFRVLVEVTNGTIGDGTVVASPDDPQEGMYPRFQVGPVYLTPPVPDACAQAEACTSAEFEMTLPAGFITEPPDDIVVEFLTAGRLPFNPPLQARVPLDSGA